MTPKLSSVELSNILDVDDTLVSTKNPEGTWASYIRTKNRVIAERAFAIGYGKRDSLACILLATLVEEAMRNGSWEVPPDIQEAAYKWYQEKKTMSQRSRVEADNIERIEELETELAALHEDKERLLRALEGIEIHRRDITNVLYRCGGHCQYGHRRGEKGGYRR